MQVQDARALKMVDYYSAHGKYLDYNLQERILDGLTKPEKHRWSITSSANTIQWTMVH